MLGLQPQNMARGLKFGTLKVDGLYCLCSENKGADQLCGDLRFAFIYMQKAGFLMTLHNIHTGL